jgi:hypothetical protein
MIKVDLKSFDSFDFSTGNYIQLVELLTSSGYEVVNFKTAAPERKHLILRHDIDFDLQAALKIAEVESGKGYRATYFVMLTSDFYNPFSMRSQQALSTLISLGHEIGLHFDTSIYDGDETALSTAASIECSQLEQVCGNEVKVVSMHRPPSNLIGENVDFAGRLNAYAPHFTKDIGYCSDSRGAWNHGSPLESVAFKEGTALQLLTHPIWWTQSQAATPQQTVEYFLMEKRGFLGREAERNCSAYTHPVNTPHQK